MSTRATYEFVAGTYTPTVTFYVHHDGYLEGAAFYFWNMINNFSEPVNPEKVEYWKLEIPNRKKGGLAAAFMRANLNAEFTESHDAHGDTEFTYTIDGFNLKVNSVYRESWDSERKYRHVFSGRIVDFVNDNADPQWFEKFSPVREVSPYLTTDDNAQVIAKLHERAAAEYPSPDNPNIKRHLESASKWRGYELVI